MRPNRILPLMGMISAAVAAGAGLPLDDGPPNVTRRSRGTYPFVFGDTPEDAMALTAAEQKRQRKQAERLRDEERRRAAAARKGGGS